MPSTPVETRPIPLHASSARVNTLRPSFENQARSEPSQPPSAIGRETPSARTTVSSVISPSATVAIRTLDGSSPGSTHTSGPAAPSSPTARQQPYHAVHSPLESGAGAALAAAGAARSAAAVSPNVSFLILSPLPAERETEPELEPAQVDTVPGLKIVTRRGRA